VIVSHGMFIYFLKEQMKKKRVENSEADGGKGLSGDTFTNQEKIKIRLRTCG
jgi:hypothetical protein